ncbi:hypothetical protein B0A52_06302 [Exophiala mesophila]|uniref:Uncharacterized protein n=1 Tax=Exophiala mesophila TaxID=212818 RepID=A0A438N315_EXOME|nr:hypothetical protein B0A52_06302 [Exophiala mesophila]
MSSSSNQPIYPDLAGKVALITGIGQEGGPDDEKTDNWGNGAAIALALARNGVKIMGCDLNIDAARRTKSRIEAAVPGAVIHVTAADVTKADQVEAFVQTGRREDLFPGCGGSIDILINNVGRSEPGGPAEMEEGVFDAQVDVNLKSVYLTTHLVLPIMEKQASQQNRNGVGGAIVNISSVAGLRYVGKPQVAYSALKAAVTQFSKHTAVMYADRGVRVNTVLPGLIFTPLVHRLADKYAAGDYEGFVNKRHNQVPMGRMGSSADVANAVVFLSSSIAARYITGQKIVVDGGFTASTGRV